MALQIVDAVYYLHLKGMLFCNIKPSNVLIEFLTPMLTDWDIADFDFDEDNFEYPYKPPEIVTSYNAIE